MSYDKIQEYLEIIKLNLYDMDHYLNMQYREIKELANEIEHLNIAYNKLCIYKYEIEKIIDEMEDERL